MQLGKDRQVRALEISELSTSLIGPVSLSVRFGDCVAIMGPSGSGKSLLLRAIADLDPNSGDVCLNGLNRNRMPASSWRRRVGFVPAESGWWADRVEDHFLAEPGVGALVKSIGLEQALGWEVSRLSTGERHRLAIARALQRRPEALLLDEPTAALDPEATAMIEALIRQQSARGVAILLVTHDRAQAQRLGSQQKTMSGGRLLAQSEEGE